MIENLEKILEKKKYLKIFNKDLSGTDDNVRNLMKLLLCISSELDKSNQNYVLHGGYAVLVHLTDCLGTSAISKWRGSYDLDLVVNEKIVVMLKNYLNVSSDRKSQNVRGKRTLKVILDESKKPYKVDLRMVEKFAEDNEEIYTNEIETLPIYGIPIRVPKLIRLLKDKLSVSRDLERDKLDTINILGIFYLKNTSPKKIIDKLDESRRERLYSLIKDPNVEIFIKENILIDIGSKYLQNFKRQLKKRIK